MTACLFLLILHGDGLGGRTAACSGFCIWWLCLWAAANSKATGLGLQQNIWAHLNSEKHVSKKKKNICKLQAFNYRKVYPFPSNNIVCKVIFFIFLLVFLMLTSCLLLYTQHHSQLPCESSGSSHSVLEEAESMLCRAVQLLLSFRCMCLFFFFNSSVKLFSSAQHLSNSFPFSIFSEDLPVSSLCGEGVNIPRFSLCCPRFHCMLNLLPGDAKREMSCTHLSRGSACVCVRVCKLMSCVPGFCSQSTKVLSELQPPVR